MDESEDVKRIRKLNHRGLLKLWSNIQDKRTPDWYSGKAFEHLVLRAFELEKVEVRWPYEVAFENNVVEQIDGAIHVGWGSFLLEAKDYSDNVGFAPIARLRTVLTRRPNITMGIVFSSFGFTEPAKLLARHLAPPSVLLWDGAEFDHALKHKYMRQGLQEKVWHAIEHGLPDHNLLIGRLS